MAQTKLRSDQFQKEANYDLQVAPISMVEITDIDTIADVASNLNGTHFTISSDSTDYYVWYSDGGGVDPAPGGTAIPVVFVANDTADQIASLTQSAIDAEGDFGAVVLTNTVTVTNAVAGSVTDAVDVDTGFTVTVTQQGTDTLIAYTTSFDFSTPSAGAVTLQVFVDGIKNIEGGIYDYTISAPNTVTFESGSVPIGGDIVEFYGFG